MLVMITNFKHGGLKRFFERDDARKIDPTHIDKVADILTALDSAQVIDDMDLVTFRLHPLTGDRKGTWSVTVRANWRITFKFENGKAFDVNYEDYH